MKRSDMVEHIAEYLITSCGLYGGAQDERDEVRDATKMQRLKLAHNMLLAVQEKQMLPPYRMWCNSNTWEPENEGSK